MVRRIAAFVPCRAGSERVLRKNTRPFADHAQGLVGLKLEQLLAMRSLDRIVLSTNDPEVKSIARLVGANDRRLVLIDRPEHLATSATSTDDLILHALECVGDGVMLWTHVTSPFIAAEAYEAMIAAYLDAVERRTHDSLASVNKIQKFLWRGDKPLNYDPAIEKWPRTQTLEPVYELNSGAFIVDVATGRRRSDRLGDRPLLFPTEGWTGFDLDWQHDFQVGELLARMNLTQDATGETNIAELRDRQAKR